MNKTSQEGGLQKIRLYVDGRGFSDDPFLFDGTVTGAIDSKNNLEKLQTIGCMVSGCGCKLQPIGCMMSGCGCKRGRRQRSYDIEIICINT